ncbi:DUF2795 domain-containing protein [Legionella saoudiensis]|uniref:DUF2795 domain-containing protein n=1 Tax=Legionella saoudiensis TaxID=1750561 RepID=UPI0007311A22|nr:DUF2795 domain-containing protein [Legionella saoudiensis]
MKNQENLSPISVQKFLKGIDYPASKQDILDCATNNGAPDEILDEIRNIQLDEFSSPTEISEELSDKKRH